MTHHIHPDPAVRTLVERAKAEALREAADAYGPAQLTGMFTGDGYVKAWLRARADSLAAQPAPEAATVEEVADEPGLRDSQAWADFNHHTPESFWGVAIWRGGGWVTGSLDVADRKRISLVILAAARITSSAKPEEKP